MDLTAIKASFSTLSAGLGTFAADFQTFAADVTKKLADLAANQTNPQDATDLQTITDGMTGLAQAAATLDDQVKQMDAALNAPPPEPPPTVTPISVHPEQ